MTYVINSTIKYCIEIQLKYTSKIYMIELTIINKLIKNNIIN